MIDRRKPQPFLSLLLKSKPFPYFSQKIFNHFTCLSENNQPFLSEKSRPFSLLPLSGTNDLKPLVSPLSLPSVVRKNLSHTPPPPSSHFFFILRRIPLYSLRKISEEGPHHLDFSLEKIRKKTHAIIDVAIFFSKCGFWIFDRAA